MFHVVLERHTQDGNGNPVITVLERHTALSQDFIGTLVSNLLKSGIEPCMIIKVYDEKEQSVSNYDDDYDDGGFSGDDERYYDDDLEFADPGGTSALRAATPSNPRIYPCPTCDRPNKLTQKDVDLGYQCDMCADRAERGWDY